MQANISVNSLQSMHRQLNNEKQAKMETQTKQESELQFLKGLFEQLGEFLNEQDQQEMCNQPSSLTLSQAIVVQKFDFKRQQEQILETQALYQKSLNCYFKVLQVMSKGVQAIVDQVKEHFHFEMDSKLEALLEVYAPSVEDTRANKATSLGQSRRARTFRNKKYISNIKERQNTIKNLIRAKAANDTLYSSALSSKHHNDSNHSSCSCSQRSQAK
jgi:hypothetical protein